MLGTSAIVRINSVGGWSVFGEVIENLNKVNINDMDAASGERGDSDEKCSPCSNLDETCACSRNPEPCACEQQACGGKRTLEESTASVSKTDSWAEDRSSRNFIGWLPRKWKNHLQKRIEDRIVLESKEKQERPGANLHEWVLVDKALLGGMLAMRIVMKIAIDEFS
ncbi:hypothetical protein F0562_002965 [Nyssa sinensis]|uniref:Uncharacterized protein n=1 Tax=Nyssa sinensis TaxID=561372 RepID=A0A5J5BUB7_9ASTE|nr:hypothetical protein F0562_002965 [Nyssa sinensis]